MLTATRQAAASETLGGTWTLCLQFGKVCLNSFNSVCWKLSTKPGTNSLFSLGGGISSYANDPSRAGQSLVECLEQALRDVPKDRYASTPLYLGATAGMRLLK